MPKGGGGFHFVVCTANNNNFFHVAISQVSGTQGAGNRAAERAGEPEPAKEEDAFAEFDDDEEFNLAVQQSLLEHNDEVSLSRMGPSLRELWNFRRSLKLWSIDATGSEIRRFLE